MAVVAGAGRRQAEAFILWVLAATRAMNVTTSVAVGLTSAAAYTSDRANAWLLLAAVLWSTSLFGVALRRGAMPRLLVLVDLGVSVGIMVGVAALLDGPARTDWTNWSFSITMSAGLVAGAFLPLRGAVLAAGALMATYAVTTDLLPALTAQGGNGVGNLISIAGFTALGGASSRYLRRHGAALDAAHEAVVRTERERAAERARYTERVRQYRTLHDTVLSTLTAISRGGLDPASPAVQARCASEADYLRRLLRSEGQSPGTLRTGLDALATAWAANGLRVHTLYDENAAASDDLPPEVAEALEGATREALSNVYRHAGTRQAWLTLQADEPGWTVRVVDRGRGFTGPPRPDRLGLRESISARVRECGGRVEVVSEPGEGTLVEMAWSPASREVDLRPDSLPVG